MIVKAIDIQYVQFFFIIISIKWDIVSIKV